MALRPRRLPNINGSIERLRIGFIRWDREVPPPPRRLPHMDEERLMQ